MEKFANSKRADQATDAYLMEFGALREGAEARMVMGTRFPDEFVSILFTNNAALSKEKNPGVGLYS